MKTSLKTIDYLKGIITGDSKKTPYLSGSKLVSFFGNFGFDDEYGQGFPSRWFYCEQKLLDLNDQNRIEELIEYYYKPINFIKKKDQYKNLIQELNEYLYFDDLKLIVKGKTVKLNNEENENNNFDEEGEFLKRKFEKIDLTKLGFDSIITNILEQRLSEIKKNLNSNSPLSAIFLTGSTLEGILFGLANSKIKDFNSASNSPKDKNNKVKKFNEWNLNDYINVAKEIGYISEDVKKFSHVLRDFRNYIHPYQQMQNKFSPDKKTAELCFKVLELAIYQISNKK